MPGKKLKFVFTLFFVLNSVILSSNIFAYQYSYPFEISSVSALLIDANNGQVVYSRNPDHRIQPASLAKVMALFLIFDALKEGAVQLKDEVVISKNAAQKEGSTMYLREGEKVPLDELIKGIAIVSGNDASVAVAEGLFGGEQELVDKMNQKVRDLNLQNSKFQTVDGWPSPDQYTTAYDMARLTHAFIREHPEAIEYHKLKQFTHANIELHNRNGLILKDPAVDGLKTGHVEEAGFHLIATAIKENQRYIAVIIGAEKIETREKEAMQLLNFGFNDLINVRLFNKEDVISHLAVVNGVKGEVGLRPSEDGVITIPPSLKEFISFKLETLKQQEAPIAIDQKLGQVIIYYQKEILNRIALVANENVPQGNTEMLVIESSTSNVLRQEYILYGIFIILCLFGVLYLSLWRPRHRFRKTEPIDPDIVRQRLDKIFKANKNK